MRNLIFILGDQLSLNISSLQDFDKKLDAILMTEVWDETKYAPHHQKKLVLIFSAMRQFKNYLQENGYKIFYTKLDEEDNRGSFDGELLKFNQQLKPQKIILTEPSEYRVLKLFNDFQEKNKVPLEIRNDDRFICSHHEFANFVKDKKTLLLENFYHQMRKKTRILMEESPKSSRKKTTSEPELKPIGGKWNYDKENRQTMPADIHPPKILQLKISQITLEVIEMVGCNLG
jgi:deoxyribodipyrimidine photolyase-related protein